MELSELAALEAAYQMLRPLNSAGRRRALQWLSDALSAEPPVASNTTERHQPVRVDDAQAKPATKRSAGRRGPGASGGTVSPSTARSPRRRTTPTAVAAAATTPSSRRSRSARQAADPANARTRAYRKMPPADEVIAAYRRVGSVGGLADHFDVPRHTVQGWARQLRRQGYSIGRTT